MNGNGIEFILCEILTATVTQICSQIKFLSSDQSFEISDTQ